MEGRDRDQPRSIAAALQSLAVDVQSLQTTQDYALIASTLGVSILQPSRQDVDAISKVDHNSTFASGVQSLPDTEFSTFTGYWFDEESGLRFAVPANDAKLISSRIDGLITSSTPDRWNRTAYSSIGCGQFGESKGAWIDSTHVANKDEKSRGMLLLEAAVTFSAIMSTRRSVHFPFFVGASIGSCVSIFAREIAHSQLVVGFEKVDTVEKFSEVLFKSTRRTLNKWTSWKAAQAEPWLNRRRPTGFNRMSTECRSPIAGIMSSGSIVENEGEETPAASPRATPKPKSRAKAKAKKQPSEANIAIEGDAAATDAAISHIIGDAVAESPKKAEKTQRVKTEAVSDDRTEEQKTVDAAKKEKKRIKKEQKKASRAATVTKAMFD